MGLCGSIARVTLTVAAGRRTLQLAGRLGGSGAETMADDNPDSDSTPRTLLRRVLDTADPRTPRRPRSARAGYVRGLSEYLSN